MISLQTNTYFTKLRDESQISHNSSTFPQSSQKEKIKPMYLIENLSILIDSQKARKYITPFLETLQKEEQNLFPKESQIFPNLLLQEKRY